MQQLSHPSLDHVLLALELVELWLLAGMVIMLEELSLVANSRSFPIRKLLELL
jgi:hypothetical protein